MKYKEWRNVIGREIKVTTSKYTSLSTCPRKPLIAFRDMNMSAKSTGFTRNPWFRCKDKL
jgi:hypothetical protein